MKGDERIRTAEQAPGADPAYADRSPSYAQLADWWLCGQLLADPKDLLRGLLDEHRELTCEFHRGGVCTCGREAHARGGVS